MSEHTTRTINQPVTIPTTSYSKPNSANRVLPDVVLQIIFSFLATQEALPTRRVCKRWKVALESDLRWVYRACIAGFPLPESSLSAAKMTELFQSTTGKKSPLTAST